MEFSLAWFFFQITHFLFSYLFELKQGSICCRLELIGFNNSRLNSFVLNFLIFHQPTTCLGYSVLVQPIMLMVIKSFLSIIACWWCWWWLRPATRLIKQFSHRLICQLVTGVAELHQKYLNIWICDQILFCLLIIKQLLSELLSIITANSITLVNFSFQYRSLWKYH